MKITTSEIVYTVAIVFMFTAVFILMNELDKKIDKFVDGVGSLRQEILDEQDVKQIIDYYAKQKECQEKGGELEIVEKKHIDTYISAYFLYETEECIKTTKTNIKI